MVEQVSQKLVIDFAEFDITDKELQGESMVVNLRDWVSRIDKARKNMACFRFHHLLLHHIVKPQDGKAEGPSEKKK